VATTAREAVNLSSENRVNQPREPRCEFLDNTTREVWQSFDPVPREWYDQIELEPGLIRVGYGSGCFDRAWFRRSPGSEQDGPVRTRMIDDREFFFCARPPLDGATGDPPRMLVDKHHSVAFDADRVLPILRGPDGRTFLPMIEATPGSPPPELPEGWSIFEIRLADEWVVDLPAPTETYWFKGARSFQGPVATPSPAITSD
jgi:hypothetical protein